MRASLRRLPTAPLALVSLVAAACGSADSDGGGGFTQHRCQVTYTQVWENNVNSMRFVHNDPRLCPIPISDLANNDVFFAGQAEDLLFDDADPNYPAVLEIKNSALRIVGGDVTNWQMDFEGDGVAELTDIYDAATGLLEITEDARDFAEITVRLRSPVVDAEAQVTLDVLFGQRASNMNGSTNVVLNSFGCGYSVASTLDGVPRTGMTNKWYLNGTQVATTSNGDAFYPWITEPGEYALDATSVDQHGYVTFSGMALNASWDNSGC